MPIIKYNLSVTICLHNAVGWDSRWWAGGAEVGTCLLPKTVHGSVSDKSHRKYSTQPAFSL